MKKLFCLLLALCLSFAAAFAPAEEDPTGTWYLVAATDPDVQGLIQAGLYSISFTLNADGSGSVTTSMFGQSGSSPTSWTRENESITIKVDDEDVLFTLGENRLTTDTGSYTMILTRDPSAKAELSPAVRAESADRFNGAWRLDHVCMMGFTMSAEESGLEQFGSIVIASGTITFSVEVEGKTYSRSMETAFTDGALVFSVPETADASIGFTGTLREDGSLVLSVESGGTEASLVYLPAESR